MQEEMSSSGTCRGGVGTVPVPVPVPFARFSILPTYTSDFREIKISVGSPFRSQLYGGCFAATRRREREREKFLFFILLEESERDERDETFVYVRFGLLV